MSEQISQLVPNSQPVWGGPQLLPNSQEIQDHDRCQEILAEQAALNAVLRIPGLLIATMDDLAKKRLELKKKLESLLSQNSQSPNPTENQPLESLNPLESLKQKTCPTKTPLILTYF